MKKYTQPSVEQGIEFFKNLQGKGSFVMLNLIRFKDKAEYSNNSKIIRTGKEAYELYFKNISSGLKEIGSEILFKGKSNNFLVGPLEEEWDIALLIKHHFVKSL